MASPQQSGYQCQFVDSVEDYECPLCLHVTREPVLTSCCGQHFCQVCISRILTDNKPCPFCKNTGFSTFFDKKQKRKVLDLKVNCNEEAEGCQWVGGLGELENHLCENCQFVEVNCPNDCGLAIQRQLLAKHQTHDCPERLSNCQYCHLEGNYQEIQDNHLPVCPKYPVSCLNECGVSPLERDQLEDHLRECPLQLVECELREMGCEEMVKRKDLVRHMEEGTQKHLTLMASKYLKTQDEMNERITKLERENEKLKAAKNRDTANLMSELKQHSQTNTTRMHVDFTGFIKAPYSAFHKCWESEKTFCTFPSNCQMRTSVFFSVFSNCLKIQLIHLPSAVDGNFEWPKKFTMTVRLFNQAGDHDHYQVTRVVEVRRGRKNDEIQIPIDAIRNPPRGVQYIRNEHLKLEILVSEK